MLKQSRGLTDIAIVGGSGLSNLVPGNLVRELDRHTPFGDASSGLGAYAYLDTPPFAFLPRHGRNHALPPHRIPYKANMWALANAGVRRVTGICIAGSLRPDLTPGTFVVPDQYFNLTWGRDDDPDPDGRFLHLPMADPYCPRLRELVTEVLTRSGLPVKAGGTVAVIQGPRFSTHAESEWLSRQGWDLVNMTQFPEVYFARRFGMCYAAIAMITDYDVGNRGQATFSEPASLDRVLEIFGRNLSLVEARLPDIIKGMASLSGPCPCIRTEHLYFRHDQ